jgi:pimeloyl-ACP methyl ester carboxylesterase
MDVTATPKPRVLEPNPVTLLLPGMTMNDTIFPQLPGSALSLTFNDLVLGTDGGGEAVREHRMNLYVRMLSDFLRTEPSWAKHPRIVVAHSFGGMLALKWLLTEPDPGLRSISGLVLIATTAGPLFDRVRIRLGQIGPRVVRIPLRPLLPLWNDRGVTRAVKRFVCGDLRVERVDFRQIPEPTDLALDLAGWCNTDWRAMRSYRFAMEGFDVRADLHRITVPTIVLHGTRDTLFPLPVARELVAGLPNAELRVARGAGHGLPLTHGEWVQRAVSDLAPTVHERSGRRGVPERTLVRGGGAAGRRGERTAGREGTPPRPDR